MSATPQGGDPAPSVRAIQSRGWRHGFTAELVGCPRCGLSISPTATTFIPTHCPRCLARRRVAIALEPKRAEPAMALRVPDGRQASQAKHGSQDLV
jgi:hypothetical protein